MTVKQYLRKNMPYFVAIFVIFYIFPHYVISLPEFELLYTETASDIFPRDLSLERIYMIFFWIGLPLGGGAIALWYVLSEDKFNAILLLEAALALPSYLYKVDSGDVLILSSSLVVMLLIESFACLAKYDDPCKNDSLLAGVAANRGFLAMLFFCTVGLLVTYQLACKSLADCGQITTPETRLLPWILVTLPVFQLLDKPLTPGGLLAVFGIFIISFVLCTTMYMTLWWYIHVTYLLIGFGLMMVEEGIFAIIRRVREIWS